MNSYNVQVRNERASSSGSTKKPWVTPAIEILALETAQAGGGNHHDSHGSVPTRS